jgi:hypothetical protein
MVDITFEFHILKIVSWLPFWHTIHHSRKFSLHFVTLPCVIARQYDAAVSPYPPNGKAQQSPIGPWTLGVPCARVWIFLSSSTGTDDSEEALATG